MSTSTQIGVVEMIHGIEVRDPYRWLEDRELPETEEWITKQSRLCDQYFSRRRSALPLRKIVSDTLSIEVIDQVARLEHKTFSRKQLAGQQQPAIWVRGDNEVEDRLLVDPVALGSNISISILRISVDGLLLAYSVRSSGSDAMEVRIVDVSTGRTLPEYIPSSYLAGFDFDAQGRGFYYCLEPCSPTADLAIRHHRFGDLLTNDVSLFSIQRTEHRRLIFLPNSECMGALITELVGTESVQDLYIGSPDTSRWSLAYRGMRGKKWPILAHGRLFLLDMEEASNGSLLELRDGANPPSVIVPEGLNRIQKCWAIRGGFLVSYLANRQPLLERWSSEGERLGCFRVPANGSIELLPQCSERSSSVFFLHETYTEAPTLWEIDLSRERLPKPNAVTFGIEKTTAVVRECSYPSRDGTRIPMTLIEPPGKSKLPQPTVLFGYGGFGTPELPRYSRLAKLLVKFGATIARPSIRGGSEFGAKWHQSATKTQKQKSIDDFIAAAEWLIYEGIADQRHLATIGSSNGGLLVAASAIQRPDLFAAVVCIGPLTDMVRYEHFDHAARWRPEYGTAEDAAEFRALLAYSPYHNVRKDTDYPAMLFVTGDSDDRCNPAHVRKMAAVLQDRVDQKNPILVDYAKEWGHVPSLSLTERIDALTRKIMFLSEQLEIMGVKEGSDDIFSS